LTNLISSLQEQAEGDKRCLIACIKRRSLANYYLENYKGNSNKRNEQVHSQLLVDVLRDMNTLEEMQVNIIGDAELCLIKQ
jgi:hypothetical protein